MIIGKYENLVAGRDRQERFLKKLSCNCWMGECRCGVDYTQSRFNIVCFKHNGIFGIYVLDLSCKDKLRMATNKELDEMEVYYKNFNLMYNLSTQYA